VLFLVGGGMTAESQESVYSGGLFELGDAEAPPGFPGMGDILLSGEQLGPDWEDLFTADGSWRDDLPLDEAGNPAGNGVPDYQELHGGRWAVFTTDDVSLGSGFEGSALAPDGRIYNAVAAADHDLGNAYVYWTTDAAGNAVFFAAAERLGGGDSRLEIELNQDVFRLGHGGYGKDLPWEVLGSRIAGDVLIQLELAAGALGAVSVSAWDGGRWVALSALPGEGCDAAETLCAVCNGSQVAGGPWPNHDTEGDPGQIAAGRFVEVGASVGALLGAQPDFTTVRFRTPQDAAFGYFGEEN
jgi:hypothetical protein